MNERNFQKELDCLLAQWEREGVRPRLLLHCCCAPCSSYVLEYLAGRAALVAFYYNPNISPEGEYRRRAEELARLLAATGRDRAVELAEGRYEPERFLAACEGLESLPEGGERCFRCYALRLREAAEEALRRDCGYFATTLSVSPYKNAEKLNELGERLAAEYGLRYLPSNFKKRGGYQRSIALSKEYGLYRQDYCGCAFSRARALAARSPHPRDMAEGR